MSWLQLLIANLWQHARMNVMVGLGMAVATAVLTGALLVGDSVRGSLRHLTLDRLGRIDYLLLTPSPFRIALAKELTDSPEFQNSGYDLVAPLMLIPSASAEGEHGDVRSRASQVTVIACDDRFWQFRAAEAFPVPKIAEQQVALNAALAERLQVSVGDVVTLRIPSVSRVPADSALAHKENRTRNLAELKVMAILPNASLARFSLYPQQINPLNAFVALSDAQAALEEPDTANALVVGRHDNTSSTTHANSSSVSDLLHPRLADLGLKLERVTLNFPADVPASPVFDYYSLSSDRMLLEPELAEVPMEVFSSSHPQSLYTYLANTLERLPTTPEETQTQTKRGPISYSTIAAVDSTAPLGPALDEQGRPFPQLQEDEILLTSWAARDQQAQVGDRVRLTYFLPEAVHANAEETSAEFVVRGIVPLTEPFKPFTQRRPAKYEDRPTVANDWRLTPEVKGVTDQDSIADWEAPFPLKMSLVRTVDDEYWENHRTTPKAYISLAAGQKLWRNRWGNVTSIRWPASPDMTLANLEERLLVALRAKNVKLGFEFQAIKQRDLAASAGTTPFDVLFLGLSFFIMASALLLVMLLFRLGIEQRATELGLLLSLGWPASRVRNLLLLEALGVAIPGAALGVLLGIAYAQLMLYGLTTWWVGAIASPFLTLHISTRSLLSGGGLGIATILITIFWSLREFSRVSLRGLLAGQWRAAPSLMQTKRWGASVWMSVGLLLVAITLACIAPLAGGGEAQAGAFLGSGMAVLAALCLVLRDQLQSGGGLVSIIGSAPIARLALRSAARNPNRSLLTLSLVASAGFLIVALSAFRLDPSLRGSGGFSLVATSAQPLWLDLNSRDDQTELFGNDAAQLAGLTSLKLRMRAGDDASCRNLYQPRQPRVLGVPPEFIQYFDHAKTEFEWAAHEPITNANARNPWSVLTSPQPSDIVVPVVLDKNTAMYSLQLYRGLGEEFVIEYPDGTVRFRVVGLLANSVFQGSLLVSESNFKQIFPDSGGYRYYLLQPPANLTDVALKGLLETRLSDEGFEVRTATSILAELLAVQNTYISAFQTLGALGLVLGTFGVAIVQARNVWERRAELGLLRAIGYSPTTMSALILWDNLVLLLGGLTLGVCAALIAVLPHFFLGGAHIPWTNLGLMLGLIVLVGFVVSAGLVRYVLRWPIIAALRGE